MNNSPPSSAPSNFPTFVGLFRWFSRCCRWLFRWRTLGWAMASLAILVTLAALVRTEETLRGKWAWQKCKRELEAQGEKLDWKEYIPPPVPDDQNFAMTPFLAPLFDFYPRAAGGRIALARYQWLQSRLLAGHEHLLTYRYRLRPPAGTVDGFPGLGAPIDRKDKQGSARRRTGADSPGSRRRGAARAGAG